MDFFDDLGKEVEDLLQEDFHFDKRISIQCAAPNGVEFTAETCIDSLDVLGKLSTKFAHSSGINVDKIQLTTDGRVLIESSLEIGSGLKFMVSIEDGYHIPGKPVHSHGTLAVQYNSPLLGLMGIVDVVNGPTMRASALYKRDFFVIGGDMEYNTQLEDKIGSGLNRADYRVGFGFLSKTWHASLRARDQFSAFTASYLYSIDPGWRVGASIDFLTDRSNQSLFLGSEKRIDGTSKLKTRINSEGVMAGAYIQDLSKTASVIFSAEIDGKDWGADTQKVGVGLKIKA